MLVACEVDAIVVAVADRTRSVFPSAGRGVVELVRVGVTLFFLCRGDDG